jgi:Mrp family chromosome partitioning ATPase
LRVITSGFIPKNPAELFGSALMKRWIKTFQDASNIDIVLIDTPPCLLFAESAILAATASADVVLVIDAKKTQRRAALRVKENFTAIGVNIRGIVLNKVHPRDNEHNYGNAYSYYYTNSLETNGTKLLQQFGSKKENND